MSTATSPDDFDLSSYNEPPEEWPLDDPEARLRIRAHRTLSRRTALGAIFGSLAAAGGVASLLPVDREIVGPTETIIPSAPVNYGGLVPIENEMAGEARLLDMAKFGSLDPIGAGTTQTNSQTAARATPDIDALTTRTPALASPTTFTLGNGRYTPSDLAYIDREAPKTDRGFAAVRGLWLINPHTKEELLTLFWSVGAYDNLAYSACCELMRDWRERQTVAMDPKLLHLLWAIQRTTRFSEPLIITSGFRTVRTNTMLRPEGAAVNSQHLHSRAADIVLGRTPPQKTALAAQEFGLGGIGYYSRFTHIDTAHRRIWQG